MGVETGGCPHTAIREDASINLAAIDDMNGAYFLTFSNQRWLGVRLDGVGIGLVFATGVLVVVKRMDIAPSISGLVMSYILQIIELLQYIVRQQAEVRSPRFSGETMSNQICCLFYSSWF